MSREPSLQMPWKSLCSSRDSARIGANEDHGKDGKTTEQAAKELEGEARQVLEPAPADPHPVQEATRARVRGLEGH